MSDWWRGGKWAPLFVFGEGGERRGILRLRAASARHFAQDDRQVDGDGERVETEGLRSFPASVQDDKFPFGARAGRMTGL